MADGLLNLREISLETLHAQVECGLALTMWLCVNEVPSLISFERQTLFYPRIHGPAPSSRLYLRFRRIVAKLRGGVSMETTLGPAECPSSRQNMEASVLMSDRPTVRSERARMRGMLPPLG